jgi:hypothetical protein
MYADEQIYILVGVPSISRVGFSKLLKSIYANIERNLKFFIYTTYITFFICYKVFIARNVCSKMRILKNLQSAIKFCSCLYKDTKVIFTSIVRGI